MQFQNYSFFEEITEKQDKIICANGTQNNDANEHLRKFLGICTLFNLRAIVDEVIYLRVFSWTLTREAKDWLESLTE